MGWGAGGGGREGCIRFRGRLDYNCACHGNQKLPLTYNEENGISVIFYRIFTKLAGIQDRRPISDEFKFQPNWIIHFEMENPVTRRFRFCLVYISTILNHKVTHHFSNAFNIALILNFCILQSRLNLCCHFIMNKGLNCRLKIKNFTIFPTLFCNKKACLQT